MRSPWPVSALLTGLAGIMLLSSGCIATKKVVGMERNYRQDVRFLSWNTEVIELKDESGNARVAVAPAWQGRVMTSTAHGPRGNSYGWLNDAHIESGKTVPHINVYGGEERFWMGPEGGQFAIFFEKGKQFVFEDWQTPAFIDTEPFETVSKSDTKASFARDVSIANYSGTTFDLRVERDVRLLSRQEMIDLLGVNIGTLFAVGYETDNRVTNTGGQAWTKETGLLSIWLLGMMKPGDQTTVVIPFQKGSEAERGPIVNDAYFGHVPPGRLRTTDSVIYFSADGKQRGKIGLSPARATPFAGSWDAKRKVLTIVQYSQPGPDVRDYVNSMWALQEKPYEGDVINSYNDGSPGPGLPPLGPFYEIETSSPAFALAPGETGQHVQRTMYFEGDNAQMDAVAQAVLGVSLAEIEQAFSVGR